MKKISGTRIVGLVIVGLTTACMLGLVFGLVVMWLWNAVMPGIFDLPTIGYWQAVGLFILAHLLFKSPGHHDHHEHAFKAHQYPGRKIRAKVEKWLNGEEKQFADAEAEPEDPNA
ncbi:MAG TPA: hypothetical protein PKW95_02125 [bacterium]|nr:hypothetical protein [bacterium]